jgi:hypothetical protein
MPPSNKAQAAGVSSGSFLELKSQVAKRKEALNKDKVTAPIIGKKNGKVRESSHYLSFFLMNIAETNQMGTSK